MANIKYTETLWWNACFPFGPWFKKRIQFCFFINL